MTTPTPTPPPDDGVPLRIYFLPNLLTAGNLFCGFVALTKIVDANPDDPMFSHTIRVALFYILLACICDLLDGRVARMGGYESPFGREFDSLADIVSFGVAPAFLVYRIVLQDVFKLYPKIGWFIASIYLICGAFRLARFNCIAAKEGGGGGKEFLGFPIPAAAGFVASLTLLLLWAEDHDYTKFRESNVRFVLPVMLVFLSMMMVSTVKYPTFKKLDFRATRTFPKMVAIVLVIGFFVILWDKLLQFVLPTFFAVYLIYGFVRPFISGRMRHEIEDEEDDETPPATN
ncbi:MAG: CDP-diacylglycerol--serine O-phosphatidyltransferase [Pedosphaera sp.]|nr:CDP-diacylglycerol--serine O-phosphatidyltransferase [Pedosphaera sp.]